MILPNGTVVLRPIGAEGIGTRRLLKCALASVYNDPLSICGPAGMFSALAAALMEDLKVIYAKHGAIQVHGIFLDYCADGLEVSIDEKDQEENLSRYDEKFEFHTDKTRQQLIAWVYSDRVQGKYRAENYRTGTNNCIHFIHECLQFLEAPVPQAVQEMIDRLHKYGPLLDSSLAPRFTGSVRLPTPTIDSIRSKKNDEATATASSSGPLNDDQDLFKVNEVNSEVSSES